MGAHCGLLQGSFSGQTNLLHIFRFSVDTLQKGRFFCLIPSQNCLLLNHILHLSLHFFGIYPLLEFCLVGWCDIPFNSDPL